MMFVVLPIQAVELNVLHCWTAGGVKWMEEQAALWEQSTGNHVEYQMAGNCANIPDMFLMAIASGTPPDILMVHTNNVPSFADKGALVSLKGLMERDGVSGRLWYPTEFEASTWDGQPYGIPVRSGGAANTLFYYNRGRFGEVGLNPDKPPTSLEELKAVSSRFIKYENDKLVELAIPFWGGDSGALAWFYRAGGQLLSVDGKQTLLNSNDSVNAMTWLQDYFSSRYLKGFADISWYSTQDRIRNAFMNQQAAMMFGGIWELSRIRNAKPDLDLGLAVAPGLRPGDPPGISVGTWVYSLPSGTKNVEAAWDLMKWLLVRPESASRFAELVDQPSAMRNVRELPPSLEGNMQWMTIVGSVLETTSLLPSFPYSPDITTVFNTARASILGSGQAPLGVLTDAARQAQGIINEWWNSR
jgi:ABC-type glycerol-3-phosphate transport system substrate-binding protein